jgi:hypothetical protein
MTVAAILMLLATAVRLLAIDLDRWRGAQWVTERASAISVAPSLIGVTTGRSQWTAPGSAEYVLLFPIAAATAAEDIAFWRAVASAGQIDGPPIQFVGVCDSGDRCAKAQGEPAIVTLSYMDPIQMHIIAIARRQGRALLYHDGQLDGPVTVEKDAPDVAMAIAREMEKGAAR